MHLWHRISPRPRSAGKFFPRAAPTRRTPDNTSGRLASPKSSRCSQNMNLCSSLSSVFSLCNVSNQEGAGALKFQFSHPAFTIDGTRRLAYAPAMSQASTPNENEKRALVVARLADVSFGTMWWVKDWLWQIALHGKFQYQRHSTVTEHPGVSILEGPPPAQNVVPMMHGSSQGTPSSVRITGFSKEDPSRATAFGHKIHPNRIPTIWIGHFPVDEAAFRREWMLQFGTSPTSTEGNTMIRKAQPKSTATKEERDQLRNLLLELRIV